MGVPEKAGGDGRPMTAAAYLGYTLTANTYRLAEVADLHRWEATDGWGAVDDTLRMTFLHDGVPDPNAIILVVDGRLFGPYDVESTDGVPGFDEVTLFGRADRYFEHTIFASRANLLSQFEQRVNDAPYDGWGVSSAIEDRLGILLRSARSLGDVRRQLARYGLTMNPDRKAAFRSATELYAVRSLELQSDFPKEEGAHRTVDAGLVAHGASYKIPDRFNRPGRFAQRPIVAGYRAPATGEVATLVDPPHADEHAGDRLQLDVQKVAEEPAGFVIHAQRWRLQNTSATASVTLTEGDVSIVPQMLLDFVPYADSGLPVFSGDSETWRVEKVVHKGEGADFTTRLDLALWQGAPGRGGDND